jgi:hypothetical protein
MCSKLIAPRVIVGLSANRCAQVCRSRHLKFVRTCKASTYLILYACDTSTATSQLRIPSPDLGRCHALLSQRLVLCRRVFLKWIYCLLVNLITWQFRNQLNVNCIYHLHSCMWTTLLILPNKNDSTCLKRSYNFRWLRLWRQWFHHKV